MEPLLMRKQQAAAVTAHLPLLLLLQRLHGCHYRSSARCCWLHKLLNRTKQCLSCMCASQNVNKHYICERPATNPNPVAPTPDNTAPVDCTTMPAMPQGAVAPVALINAGGPAMCNYFAADNDASPGEHPHLHKYSRWSQTAQLKANQKLLFCSTG